MAENSKTESNGGVEMELLDFLKKIPLFDTLTEDELSIVAGCCRMFAVDKGDILFKEGGNGNSICFVLDGSFDVIKKADFNLVEIVTLSKGCSIGELSFVDGSKRSATVKARSQATLASLHREKFEGILDTHPEIGIKILKALLGYISMNMRRTSRHLACYKENYMSLLFDSPEKIRKFDE